MREEQVRRWRLREEEEEEEEQQQRSGLGYCSQTRTVKSKQVRWLLGRDGDVSVMVIGETDEFRGCKLLQNINNRLRGDNLNGIQTQRSGNQEEEPGYNRTHTADDLLLSPPVSSEEDMDLKESDSSDSDSGSGTEAPPLYRPHPRLHRAPLEDGPLDTPDRDLVTVEKPPSSSGRVAELRKAFASDNSALSSCSKPPIPTKPVHLQRPTCIH
uniref:Uncharacterized protein n=1 Tax=Knipowitschia caucasica TaxID=637954 RepID=A0AAV2MLF4_KNICA